MQPPVPSINLDALHGFIDALRAAGFNIGMEHYTTTHDLLLVLAARRDVPADVSTLQRWLKPVLCSSSEELEEFDRVFLEWGERILRNVGSGKESPAPPDLPDMLSLVGKRYRTFVVGTAVFLVAVIVFIFVFDRQNSTSDLPVPTGELTLPVDTNFTQPVDTNFTQPVDTNFTQPDPPILSRTGPPLPTEEEAVVPVERDIKGEFAIDPGITNKMAQHPTSGQLATSRVTGEIEFWDTTTNPAEKKGVVQADTASITGMIYTPDGNFLVIATEASELFLIDVLSGEVVGSVITPHVVSHFLWAGTNSLLSGGQDGGLAQWCVDSRFISQCKVLGKEYTSLRLFDGDSTTRIAFSPDGSYIVTSSGDNTARVTRVSDGAEVVRVAHGDRCL